jgi:hypothetical protein
MRILPCLLLTALAANAGQQPDLEPAPVVEVFVPPVMGRETSLAFQQAEEVATRIYATIGVRVIWTSKGRQPTGCVKEPMHRSILVKFQESDEGRRVSEQALAFSNPFLMRGPCVTLMMDRLRNAIQLNPLSAPLVLGHVLAHELGHVLEGVSRHSYSGLMKARWSLDEVAEVMKYKRLEFAIEDADLIRGSLGARQPPTTALTEIDAVVGSLLPATR